MNNIIYMQDLIERAENYRKNLKVFKLDKFEEFTFEDFIYTNKIIQKNKKKIYKQKKQ